MRLEHWLYTIPMRLRSLFRRRQMDQELEGELRDHVEQKTVVPHQRRELHGAWRDAQALSLDGCGVVVSAAAQSSRHRPLTPILVCHSRAEARKNAGASPPGTPGGGSFHVEAGWGRHAGIRGLEPGRAPGSRRYRGKFGPSVVHGCRERFCRFC